MGRAKKYTADDIDVLEGLEAVRNNVSVYLGRKDSQVFHALKEVYENSVDVYLKGMNDYVSVVLEGTKIPQTFTVIDKGPGIPVEKHKKSKISTLTTVMTTLHAGSNFRKAEEHKAVSRGVHGVGVSCVNAVSNLIVWTNRDGQWYKQSFEKGKPTSNVEKCKFPNKFAKWGASKEKGTIVQYTPDYSILPQTVIKEKEILDFLKSNADLNSGLKVRFIGTSVDETFFNKKGILSLLEDFIVEQKKIEVMGKPFVFESEFVSVAIQWSSLEGEHPLSYVNGSNVPLGGSHLNGLYTAITKEFKAVAGRGIDFTASDLREGLIAVIHYKCNDDEYTGQDKTALDSPSATKVVQETVSKPLAKWIKANSKLVREISLRATQIKAAKAEARAITKAASKLKTTNKHVLVPDGKLVMSDPGCSPEKRELLICEGDSASGGLKDERDAYYQEILKLRGKILNVFKTSSLAKDLENREVRNLLVAMGADEKKIKRGEKLDSFRVGKIIILCDEDIDGYHLRVLLYTAILKYAPEAFKQGIVYTAKLPFFQASNPKTGEKVFGSSLKDVQQKGGKNWHISRLKGLGELNSDELAPFCLYPETRQLVRVSYFNSNKEYDEYKRMVGDDTLYRKQMLGVL